MWGSKSYCDFMVVQKIFGWISVVIGALMIISFPAEQKYMPDKFANAGIVIGIFLIALGIFLIKS